MGFHMTPNLPEQLIAGKEREYINYFFRHFAYSEDAIAEEDMSQYVRAYSALGAMHAAFDSHETRQQIDNPGRSIAHY